ncbi:hypothetical protein RIR_jg28075.t1 [Rhizophagus irregularis DAOM 181602=DAOM 197198]|nr:hypothetical protein RIR_jg28075.t1 [Rhizophagus irregularis DAOM 181602=DAOM 197198]
MARGSTKSCDQEYKQRPRYMNRRQQLKVFGYKSNHYKGNKSGIFAEVAGKGQRNLRKGIKEDFGRIYYLMMEILND